MHQVGPIGACLNHGIMCTSLNYLPDRYPKNIYPSGNLRLNAKGSLRRNCHSVQTNTYRLSLNVLKKRLTLDLFLLMRVSLILWSRELSRKRENLLVPCIVFISFHTGSAHARPSARQTWDTTHGLRKLNFTYQNFKHKKCVNIDKYKFWKIPVVLHLVHFRSFLDKFQSFSSI